MKQRWQFYLGLLTYLATTGLFYLGLLVNPCWFLVWIYPAPILLYSFNSSRQKTILVSFAAFATASISVIVPEFNRSLLPTPLEVVPSILHSLMFTAFVVLNRYSIRRVPFWLAPFILPVFFTAYQFIWNFSTLSNFIHFGVSTQANYLPLLQVASITGPVGIAFLTHYFANCTATIVYFRRKPIKWLTNLLVLSIVFSATLGYGYYRLAHPESTQRVKVALGAINPAIMTDFAFSKPQSMQQRINDFPKFLSSLASHHPMFVLTPEIWLQLQHDQQQAALSSIEAVAKQYHTTIIAPVKLLNKNDTPSTNSAWIINQQGKLLGRYDKIHLIPYVEDNLTAGCCPKVFSINGIRIGVAIGDDMLFRQPALNYGRLKTQLLFIPSADNGFKGTSDERRRVAMVHTVSNGISMARAAEFGELTLTDAYGRLYGNMQVGLGETATMTGQVPIGMGPTFYTRHPFMLGYLMIIAALYIIAKLLLQLPKVKRSLRLRHSKGSQ